MYKYPKTFVSTINMRLSSKFLVIIVSLSIISYGITDLAYGQQSFPDGFNRGEEDTSINMQGIPKLYNTNFTSEDPSQFRFPFPSEGYFNKMKPVFEVDSVFSEMDSVETINDSIIN